MRAVRSSVGRGKMEKDIGEFKADCFGARASATAFHTNSYRMLLAMLTQLVEKVARRLLLRGLRSANKAAKPGQRKAHIPEMSLRKFKQQIVNVSAQIEETGEEIILTLAEYLLNEKAFLAFFHLRQP